MNNYTKIPNQIFEESQLSINARYLYCLLLKYAGKNDCCYPSQKTLARVMGYSERYVRKILIEIELSGLILSRNRKGFNKSNNYKISKDLCRNNSSCMTGNTRRNTESYQIGSMVPLATGPLVPYKSTQLKEKENNNPKNLAGLEKCRQQLLKQGFNVRKTNEQKTSVYRRGGGADN